MAKRNITLHDKHKSTTALYPKIDAKSLTQEAITEITRITEVVVEEQVVPNPTPTGTPTELQYITINGVEYYIKEGTLVIANPTLAGTESDLTGIQIGDVKYKIPSGVTQVQSNWNETDNTSPAYIQNKPSKYLVNVCVSVGSYTEIYLTLLKDSSGFYNYDGLVNKLISLGARESVRYGASGFYNEGYAGEYPVYAVSYVVDNNVNKLKVFYVKNNTFVSAIIEKADALVQGIYDKII